MCPTPAEAHREDMNETPTLAEPLDAPDAAGAATADGSATTAPPPPYPPPPYPGPSFGAVPRPPLLRSRQDRVIGGVCGGIGRRYGIDPVLLRILTVVATLFSGGTFLIAYVLGWAFIRDEPAWDAVPMPGQPASPGVGPSYAAGGTGTFVDPATGQVAGGYSPYTPPRRTEPRSYLGLIAVSLSLVVGGVLSVVAVAGASIPVAVIAASMLAVLGIGLVVAAVRGRARWLIAPAVLMLLVTQASLALPRDLTSSFGSGTGTRTWTPTTLSSASYQLGAGDATLDLRRLPVGTARLTAHVGLGTLVVLLPPDSTLVLSARVGAGDIVVPGLPDQAGTSQRVDTTIGPGSGADGRTTVDLTAEVGLGEVEVRHATS
jgi:phage shock protein PspC (stress-responsive transcriptional regulator)